MNIAVADDDKSIREYICELIKKHDPECSLNSYAAGKELLASGKNFDIVFLDIKMNGINGINTAKLLRERREDVVLVFVTGIKEHVFEALELYAFQYLLKPIDEKKLIEVLYRAEKEADKNKERCRLFIKTKNLTIDQSDILYIESHGKKLEIHTVGLRENIVIYGTLENIQSKLGENFYRCHRSYIVNMMYIEEYDNESITLVYGDKVYLTKKKYGEFVKAYMWYLQKGGVPDV
ncbi:MAG: LytTR family DNA-binding domain-containing protein [Oscillospiraceae bacterium]|nr:LytTR family DNA-binding domain-containing protein [Oscillospiraceae bacterium]